MCTKQKACSSKTHSTIAICDAHKHKALVATETVLMPLMWALQWISFLKFSDAIHLKRDSVLFFFSFFALSTYVVQIKCFILFPWTQMHKSCLFRQEANLTVLWTFYSIPSFYLHIIYYLSYEMATIHTANTLKRR